MLLDWGGQFSAVAEELEMMLLSGPDRLKQRRDAHHSDHPLDVFGENAEAHLGSDFFSVLVRKCVLPIHDLSVPKTCSTVRRQIAKDCQEFRVWSGG